MVLILECAYFSCFTARFASVDNIFNVLRQVAMTGIISIGMTFVMITGGIDLSVGSIAGMSVLSCALMLVKGIHPVLACAISVTLSVLVGALNGWLVAHMELPALIATLGTETALRGLVYISTNASPVFGFTESFRVLGQGYVFGVIPIPVLIAGVTLVIAWIYINMTTLGRYTYAVGGNEEVARLSGISVRKVKYITYMISGFCAGLAGIILLSRLFSGQPRAGLNYEMEAITAVVLGGVSVSGGHGRLSGVIIGVLIMGVLSNGMIMLGVNEYWQMFLRGTVLIIAVCIDIRTGRSVGKRKKSNLSVVTDA
jgi:ribose/xylose/arabinose/galactoside ABC-type transport system permease subunit